MSTRPDRRKVVITGVGAVTPLGVGAARLHERWADGVVGISDGAGACRDYEAKDFLSVKAARRLDRFSQFAVTASGEALEQAGWAEDELPYDPLRVGCVIATGIGGIYTVESQHDVMRERGAKMISPLGIPQYMPNAAAAAVSMKHGLRGQSYGVVSACASGGHALGLALRTIQYGDADAVVCGGSEATLTEFGFGCFNSMQALSPTGTSRPFDIRRDGFVMGEGAAVLVLEEAEAAAARGATVLAELVGYGSTSDAYHLTAPEPDGVPAASAIELALADAGVGPAEVDYVNAHGTSTQLNDAAETAALKRALGEDARRVPISSTKSSIGHLLGAAGAVEAVATIQTLRTGVIAPTLGYEEPDPELDLDYVPGESRPLVTGNGHPPLAISNSFAFGGHNVTLAFRGGELSATALTASARRLSPLERLEILCDPGSLRVLRSQVRSSRLGDRATEGDGVVAATGSVDGRPIACYAQDGAFMGGSLGERHADAIVRVLGIAERAGMPVVSFVESGGARMQEGTAALAGYGRIFRQTVALTGRVPQISVVSGASAGGGAYSPALTDLIIMTEDAAMFLTGPAVVREALGEEIDAAGLGGPHVHARNGVCHLVEHDEAAAAARVRTLLSYLPAGPGASPVRLATVAPVHADPGELVPAAPRSAYDIRDALGGILDGSPLQELWPRWARNMVCGLARLGGRPVGVVANQPRYLGGVLDAEGSEKAARFVRFCDDYGLPLLTFVDTPGFMPGSRQEQAGVIRRGAELVRAFAAARVPKFTVILRKSYGGAYITMNSRDLGADLVLAWPDAELGIMSARAAVGIVNRRELRVAGDPEAERDRLADAYAREHLRAESAAAEGFVDEIIAPAETRDRLASALEAFSPR